jgi:predicted HicB family RNase H-like nuclease
MKPFNYKGYLGLVDCDDDHDFLHGKILEISDLVTYEAETLSELRSEFEAAVDDYLETCKMVGKPPQKAYSGAFNVRPGSELHRKVATLAIANGLNLNEFVVKALKVATSGVPVAHVEHNHHHNITLSIQPEMEKSVWTGEDQNQLLGNFNATTYPN